MGFLSRFAVGVLGVPAVLKSWPQLQLLPAAGALVDFVALRFKERKPAGLAAGRAAMLALVLEASICLTLAALQAYFYWSPG